MHSSSVVAVLVLFSAASPAFSAPIVSSKASRDTAALDARASGLSDLAISALKGLATGGGLAALTAGAEHFLDPTSSTSASSKRELSAEDIAFLKRASGLSDLALSALKGLATGGGLAAVTAGAEHFLDPSSASSTSSRRDLTEVQARGLASILGGAAEDTIGDVLKKGAVGGIASAIGGSAVGGLIDDLDGSSSTTKRDVIGTSGGFDPDSSLDDILQKLGLRRRGIAGASVSGRGVEQGIDEGFEGLENFGRFFRRDLGQDIEDGVADIKNAFSPFSNLPLLSTRGLGQDIEDGVTDIKNAFSPFSNLPLLSTRGLASLLGGAAEDTVEDVLKKGAVGGVASAVGGTAIGGLIEDFTGDSSSSKRELNEYEARQISSVIEDAVDAIGKSTLAKGVIGTGVSLGASTLAGDTIDEAKKIFQKREALNIGPLAKGVIGTGVSLGASTLAGDAIDKVESLFRRSSDSQRREIISTLLAARSLNELD